MRLSQRSPLHTAILAAAVLLAPLAALAQEFKPVAVVSIASLNENLTDLEYLARTAGMEDAGKSANFFARALTAGIDKSRPIGLYVVPQGRDFHSVAFIPVSNLKVLLDVQKEYVGDPKDVGGGVLEIGVDKTAYLKEQAGWAFVAESKEPLATLPADPLVLLGDMPKTYNFAAKLLVQNIPVELRRTAIDQLKIGMERHLSAGGGRVKYDRKAVEQLLQTWLGNLERFTNEADELVLGLGIDGEKRHTVLDFRLTAKDGTALARQLALQSSVTTKFSGFMLPEAAATFQAATKYSPEQLAEMATTMKASREAWTKQLDDTPALTPEKREAAKRVAGKFFDEFEKTAALGKGDVGGALVLLPKSIAFVGGGFVADGPAFDKALQDAFQVAKDQPNFPKVQLNAGKVGELSFHRLTVSIPEREEEARQLLGDTFEILVGIGPQSIIVAGGKDSQSLLQQVLDRSAAEPEKAVAPLSGGISLLPILKFYQSIDRDNPLVGGLISTLEQSGNDRITVVTQAGSRDSTTRLEIQEGLMKAIGEGVKVAAALFQGGGL